MWNREEIERIEEQLSKSGLIEEPKKEIYKGVDFGIENYGWNRSLEDYSDRELRDELKRRKNLKPRNGFRK